VVRRMFKLAIDGLGSRMISWMLECEGMRPRPRGKDKVTGPWPYASVMNILRSTTYVGNFRVFRKLEDNNVIQVPPIVTQDTWDDAQAALARRKLSSGAPARHNHLLRGSARCGVCGNTMWATTPKPGEKSY